MFSDFCLSSLLICVTVVIIADKPKRIIIVLMCTVGINAV